MVAFPDAVRIVGVGRVYLHSSYAFLELTLLVRSSILRLKSVGPLRT